MIHILTHQSIINNFSIEFHEHWIPRKSVNKVKCDIYLFEMVIIVSSEARK